MIADGELDRGVMRFGGEGWLELPRGEVGALDRHGEHSAVTVAALVRFDAREQAHGHISHVGGPTPGFDFCVTYATGGSRLPMKKWIHLALAYDGAAIDWAER